MNHALLSLRVCAKWTKVVAAAQCSQTLQPVYYPHIPHAQDIAHISWLTNKRALRLVWFLGSLHQRCRRVVCWWKNSAEARLGGMIEQSSLKQISKPASLSEAAAFWYSQIYGKSNAKMLHPLPYQHSYRAFDLRKIYKCHHPLSSCEGLFRVPSPEHPLLLIGHFAKLSNRLKEEMTCLPAPLPKLI